MKFRQIIAPVLIVFPTIVFSQGNESDWPKDIPLDNGGKITIYQPQPETFVGDKITGRAAVSIRQTSSDEPIFGAVWFNGVLLTDKDNRTAELETVNITNSKFPGIEDQSRIDNLKKIIEAEAPKWKMEISLDELVTSIQETQATGSDNFKNDPPQIIYRNRPTTLILLDGEPKVQKDKDLDADRVVNTPFLIFKEGNQWNLYAGGLWYVSRSITTGWTPNNSLSQKVKSVDTQMKTQDQNNNGGEFSDSIPESTDILVSTSPSELLQTRGEADFRSIQGTQLLYVSNSPNEIFKDIASQQSYVLLTGRWFSAPSINGPWTYVPADKLPADFAKIPEGSEKDGVLSSVAGTEAADEAKLDAVIPQTAKVDRKTATVTVQYDGNPQFRNIEGTSLRLAENANKTVMQDADGKYFALDNGIWFVSNSPNGPWAVANDRPRDVEKIPPTSEAFNTKFVYVYDVTPNFVYVGYTPGYMCSYIFGPTVVYGTGFYYHPWYRSYFFPRPVTWGFGFVYNPWTGWSMNFGWGFGFWHARYRPGYWGGWFGPPMFRPPYRPWGFNRYPYRGGFYGRNRVPMSNNVFINTRHNNNIYNNQRGVVTRDVNKRPAISNRPGNQAGNMNRPGNPGNVTRPGNANNLPSNVTRPATGTSTRPVNTNNQRPPFNTGPGRQPNNVYADRDGNILQRDNKGNWNQRDNNSRTWKPATRETNPSIGNMNRESNARDRGADRTNNFRTFQQSAPPTRQTNRPTRAPQKR